MPKYNVHYMGNVMYYINVVQVLVLNQTGLPCVLLEQCDIAIDLYSNKLIKCRWPVQELLACKLEVRKTTFHSV